MRRRHGSVSGLPLVEFLQVEVEQLQEQVDKLKRESAAHTRRCAEMQSEIDLLKKSRVG